jgi:hypothetical protein
MCDKLVYDLAMEVEGSPSVFIRKDWINILDNQTQNYTSNQSVTDTSQLSNSNRFLSYRESYFLIPMTMTIVTNNVQTVNCSPQLVKQDDEDIAMGQLFTPDVRDVGLAGGNVVDRFTSADNLLGLKNWFGNIIHSFTLDYNGSTIAQQTPFLNMWNSFKLLTSLSYNDVITQGCSIGFYPDDPESFSYYQPDKGADLTNDTSTLAAPYLPRSDIDVVPYSYPGTGTCNNSTNSYSNYLDNLQNSSLNTSGVNKGLKERQKWINFDLNGICGKTAIQNVTLPNEEVYVTAKSSIVASPYANLLSNDSLLKMWKSYICFKQNQAESAPGVQSVPGVLQYAIIATVYLKHIHSFFNMCPLLKGVFMKMTMNLNNSASTVLAGYNVSASAVGDTLVSTNFLVCSESSSALGGVSLPMISSNIGNNGGRVLCLGNTLNATAEGTAIWARPYRLSLSVGATVLDTQTNSIVRNGGNINGNNPCKSIYLYVPAYIFSPPFEQAYISSPVKAIKYTDIYQYQVLNVQQQFNNLLTNGIANVKSVLIIPFYSTQNDTPLSSGQNAQDVLTGLPSGVNLGQNTGFVNGVPVFQSPFDTAGCGTTSPLCHFTNFNVQVSGQNAIYNLQLRNFEQFNNQLYGQNAVNGGLTDGITSSLISRQGFDLNYCYYYVNVERMLPVEQSVPKSIQILGTNLSQKKLDLYCFIEYGTEIQIDVLTGARV